MRQWVMRYSLRHKILSARRHVSELLEKIVNLDLRLLKYNYRYIRKTNQKKNISVIGMIRERNESLILDDALDHLSEYVDGIIVFDDASTDDSVEIALSHKKVLEVIVNKKWKMSNRKWEETANRSVLQSCARKYKPQWFFYMDADERFEGDIRGYLLSEASEVVDGIRISLLDAYITEKDQAPYVKGNGLHNHRKWFGIERRDILMIWRNNGKARYVYADSREPSGIDESRIITKFWCQHYGKSISVEQWDQTCRYYADNFPMYSEKWRARLGLAVHTKSDFGTKLRKWPEAKSKSVKIN